MNTPQYLEAFKTSLGIKSDYALAQHLNLTRSYISKLHLGKASMPAHLTLAVAKELAINPVIVMLDMQRERAKTPQEKAIWQEIFTRLQICHRPFITLA